MSDLNGQAMVTTTQAPMPVEGRGVDVAIIERVIALGDLSKLQPGERVNYYVSVCRSVGLNPLTKPFDYLSLNGKLVLYATKNCTDQLRQIHAVSVDKLRRETHEGVHVVTAEVSARDGRRDEDIGAVSIAGLKGESLANALMKATTKAKRRATLSVCGLSFVDESEIESIPHARRVAVTEQGEILEAKALPPAPSLETQLAASVAANWPVWADKHVQNFAAANDMSELLELWGECHDEVKKLKPPKDIVARVVLAKDSAKVALEADSNDAREGDQ